MARPDTTETVSRALYDNVRLQFVAFVRIAVDFPNSGATGLSGAVTVACAGALLGDYVLMGSEAIWEAGVVLGVPQISVADTIALVFSNGTAGALNPASNTCRFTVLRAN